MNAAEDSRDILVIDDEIRMAESIRRLLSNWGYAVDVANSGREGIEKITEKSYPLVFTDLRMADLDGYDVMRYIHEEHPETLLIIITGHASTESAIEAVHFHAFDYITKPFDIGLLRKAVERAFDFINAKRQREEMLYMMTHDIKVPLSSILGYASMVYDKNDGTMRPDARTLIDNIYLLSEKTVALIDNFLATTKISSGMLTPTFREADIRYIIEDLKQVIDLETQKKKQKCEIKIAENVPLVHIDESLIYRALGNLIINAVKYTDQGGRIEINVECCESDNSCPIEEKCICVEFGNSGPGIDPEDMDSLFNKYHRAKNVAGIQGSGLGLYVVKNIVDVHKGHIEVMSTPDEWTTFRMYIPAIQTAAE